ncbi:MAG: hypothetical protein WA191_05120 [Telluria sp.]
MDGTVILCNNSIQRFAVRTADGITVFDLQSGELAMHHVVSGNLDDHGDQQLLNLTTAAPLSVYIEAIHADRATAIHLLSQRH